MKLLTSSALLGVLCISPVVANAATPAPIKPPAKTAIDKTAPPQDAFGVFTFDKAKAEADKKKRPLVFLISDERADDAAVKTATNRTYWTFWDDATVVLLHGSTANEWTRLPEPVQKAAKSAELGKGFPRLFAFDEDVTTPLLGMKSDQIIGKDEKALDKIAKAVKSANKTKTASTEYPPPSLVEAAPPAAAPKPGATTPPAKPGATPAAPAPAPAVPAVILIKGAQPESWTNVDNHTIQATLAEAGADKVVFVMPNGARVEYDIAKLSDTSKKRVEALKAASTPH